MTASAKLSFCVLTLLVVLPGVAGVCIFGHAALVDWAALQSTYAQYEQVERNRPDMPALFAAYAQQDIFRINLFADGVWVLLAAIYGSIGLHGICFRAVKSP